MGRGSSKVSGSGSGGGGGAMRPAPMTLFEKAGVSGLPANSNDITGPQMANIVSKMGLVIDAMQDGDSISWQMAPWDPQVKIYKTHENGNEVFVNSNTRIRMSASDVKRRLMPDGTPEVPDMLSISEGMRIVNNKSVGGIVGYWRIKH